MSRYFGSEYRQTPKGEFFKRYVQACKEKSEIQVQDEKAEFDSGYKQGKLRYAVATKFLSLKSAGLDRYVEAKDNLSVIWKREGDQILRLDSDTSWIEELLKIEGNR